MQTTQYYGLKKPEETDVATPEDFNNNMDILAGVLKKPIYSNCKLYRVNGCR